MSDTDRIKVGIGYILCLLFVIAMTQSSSALYPFVFLVVLFMVGIAIAYRVILALQSAFRRGR